MTDNSTQPILARRQFLKAGACGLGSLTLAGLIPRHAGAGLLSPKRPHFAPKAKRVIFIFINGGPSQFESFDHKPGLKASAGKKGLKKGKLLGPLLNFAQHGESGMWFSEAFPHLAKQADHLCMLNGMQTTSRAHPIAIPMLHTGEFQFVRPSLGAWLLYGLGTENQNLPGFFTIKPTRTFGGPANYGSAFLPSSFQATRLGWGGQSVKNATISNLTPAHGRTPEVARASLELAQALNKGLLDQTDDVRGVIDSLELSQQMQQAVPEVMDIAGESKSTQEMYGIGDSRTDDFARQCLLARRLTESGVRFVEISSTGWDHHSNLNKFGSKAATVDKPVAALLADLNQRGLLDDTLVLWTGEFGRTPETQVLSGKETIGRDHNAEGYTAWLAGGGVRAGLTHGMTDELGYKAVEGKVHLHDLHATMLHLMGLDHKRLVYRYGGRDFRLTNVHGDVVHDIIA
ncbi:MAG: DUF1501 domain-containing protein [Planctomycetaceae bacterium]|nr:DUF1501 domain-containing protein [Planctomycetaceae bacterium]MBT6156912.1 DUF1501 domain-containing protein [Planctomycetaceae bacterium]MBT6496129.1 DUF1501 domain-containing protein [Planctomycetaceae bacterium]